MEGNADRAQRARPEYPSHLWRVRRRGGGAALTPPYGSAAREALLGHCLPLPLVPHSSNSKQSFPPPSPLATTYMLFLFCVCVSGCRVGVSGQRPAPSWRAGALPRGARWRRRAVLAQARRIYRTLHPSAGGADPVSSGASVSPDHLITSLTSGGSGAEPHSAPSLYSTDGFASKTAHTTGPASSRVLRHELLPEELVAGSSL